MSGNTSPNLVQRLSERAITRADIVPPNRLQGFSDAVFATAATLLIIPVRKFELEEGETLKDALVRHAPLILVFWLGYLVICTLWESQVVRYKVLEKVDDMLVGLNLVSLMIITFLPFSVSLQGHYSSYETSVFLNALLLLAHEICELIIFIYGFSNPALLSESFKQLQESEQRVKRHQIYTKVIFNCSLFILAIIFSYASFIMAYILICSVLLTPFLKNMIIRCTELSTRCQCHDTTSTFEVLTGRISKERMECFTDAAVAIVATLLILDLTTEEFPKAKDVKDKGLLKVLEEMSQNFVSYIGTYTMVAFLWFIHHSVVQHILVFTRLLVATNRTFLALVALSPFLSTLTNKYTGHISSDSQTAVCFSSFIIFLGSFVNVLLIIFSLFDPNITMEEWARPRDEGNPGLVYLSIKALIIPVVAFVTFVVSLGGPEASYYVFHINIFLAPALFIVLKIFYACHCCHAGQEVPMERLQEVEEDRDVNDYEEDVNVII